MSHRFSPLAVDALFHRSWVNGRRSQLPPDAATYVSSDPDLERTSTRAHFASSDERRLAVRVGVQDVPRVGADLQRARTRRVGADQEASTRGRTRVRPRRRIVHRVPATRRNHCAHCGCGCRSQRQRTRAVVERSSRTVEPRSGSEELGTRQFAQAGSSVGELGRSRCQRILVIDPRRHRLRRNWRCRRSWTRKKRNMTILQHLCPPLLLVDVPHERMNMLPPPFFDEPICQRAADKETFSQADFQIPLENWYNCQYRIPE